ncbi:Rtn family protein [Buttiauxella ferragutiae ATCC 51602]|uniref:cyclic-guanylate-specific phosphodiesterase n=1 Tax=Buttiauxella ferragutiae ATCC 51602 TaxID=1354252 RepID=A0ABX2W7R3_9ENTR|nr:MULTISPECIES: cyclic di-GMP phosphodiesterase [Buttiauxella]AYN29596.1 cyclic di-GMP phosphodiesterase [Buttiauxella sp. 3AFRM03]MCE0828563.1 cyclic di-GMP phosphodiesterase [Buttiauxella ferragutiae]OAT27269.1 Rtn family protein [Buttiauxella ferragutiae ATCC 51602]TDN55246.1 EAL domain-containing protein (putative c-di-GMP-specific phosphodiesterase class I) [Buttiauxella sp. JUb87]UNK62727.1 cyclic di-GMP phosphodiesterase [Buttiauxella ferragutiae]
MFSKNIFSRYFTSIRQIAAFSILAGILAALLIGGITSLTLHSKREASYDMLTQDIRDYLSRFFNELQSTTSSIQPLTLSDCHQVAGELTSRAAFNANVRAFVLVRNGEAYCSSATGSMLMDMHQIVPDIDLNQSVDIDILHGTPMMPGKPTVTAWFKNPVIAGRGVFATLNVDLTPYLLFSTRQSDLVSMAIIVGNKALTTQSNNVMNVSELPTHPTRIITLQNYPIKLALYGETWPAEDIQISILTGLVFGILSSALCAWLLTVRLRSGKEILTGIKRGQFSVVYQPVVNAKELKMSGVEVLMRWNHPIAGPIPPDAFIAFAEAQQLIVPLTRHLFELIARDAKKLQHVLPPGARLGINLAPSHLHSPTFKEDIQAFAASMPPHHFQLIFEITERDMVKENEASCLFTWMHEQGYEIAVDDFGTGHSALIYLERFKLDYLKIDRGFVNSIGFETVTSPVLDAVLTLARKLSMTTVAEGVETREQAKWLIDQGVNYLQGYYFSRPLTFEQLQEWEGQQKEYQELT